MHSVWRARPSNDHPEGHVTDDEKAEVICDAIDAFFADVDSDDWESDELAWVIVRAMNQAENS
ncbi:hypothetical protein GCM10009731_30640 [Streptomyces globosus]